MATVAGDKRMAQQDLPAAGAQEPLPLKDGDYSMIWVDQVEAMYVNMPLTRRD